MAWPTEREIYSRMLNDRPGHAVWRSVQSHGDSVRFILDGQSKVNWSQWEFRLMKSIYILLRITEDSDWSRV
jgi:hypothetical protein